MLTALMLFMGFPSLHAVKKDKGLQTLSNTEKSTQSLPKIPVLAVEKFEKEGRNAIILSAIGVVMLVGVIAVLSLGTMTGALPLLALGGLFANIGFIKAMRLIRRTKSRKRTFRKARERAKTAIILACILGIGLIFGLLSLLMNNPAAF